MTTAEKAFVSRTLGVGVLSAALDGRVSDLLSLLMTGHADVMETPQGQRFALGLSIREHAARHGDDYIPSGCIPDVLTGTIRNLRAGCYTFGEILDLSARHLVSTGEAQAVEARLRAGVTVREFLRTRYGVVTGAGERGDRSDLKRFRSWLADARWRIRKLRADDKRRALLARGGSCGQSGRSKLAPRSGVESGDARQGDVNLA